MKKLLFAALLAAGSFGAQAAETFSGSMLWGYCTTPYTAVNFGETVEGAEAMYLSPEAIKEFVGCKITAVAIANGTRAKGSTAESLPINVFMTDTLGKAPMLSFDAAMPLDSPLAYTEYTLPEPITITAGMKPAYFGFTGASDPAVGSPLVVDATNNANGGEGDWLGLLENGKWNWMQVRDMFGFGCVRLKIEGSRLPADRVAIQDAYIPATVTSGSQALVEMHVANRAGNVVNSVSVSYKVNGGEAQSAVVNLPRPLLFNEYNVSTVSFPMAIPAIEAANMPVEFTVTGVNDEPNNILGASASEYVTVIPAGKGFKKAMMAEISTGTWCGFCPQGILGCRKMLERYSDGSFIPVAVHTGDDMAESSYASLNDLYTQGAAPAVLVNRNVAAYGMNVPTFEFLNSVYQDVVATPAAARASISAVRFDPAKKTLDIDASAEFAISDPAADYALGYVIVEDGVGPFEQHNYFSPEYPYHDGALEWWDKQPEWVETTFNHVARMIRRFNGVTKSIPAAIEAGVKYDHSESLQTNAVTDIEKTSVIAFVVNRTTKRIENAVCVPYSSVASIGSISVDNSAAAPARVYDLQGRPVAAPVKGQLYISNGHKFVR